MANRTILAVGPVPQASIKALLAREFDSGFTVIGVEAATMAAIEKHDDVTADTPLDNDRLDPAGPEAEEQWNGSVNRWVLANLGVNRQDVAAAIFTSATFDELSDPTRFNRGAPAGNRFNDYFPDATRWISVTDEDGAYEI